MLIKYNTMFGQTNYTPIRPNFCHTNGLPNSTDYASTNSATPFRMNNPQQSNELLNAVMDQPLKFEPGSCYEYSNTNYVILGIILEKVGGKDFGELLQDAVEKMGVERLFFRAGTQEIPITDGYDESMLNMGKRIMTAACTGFESYAITVDGISVSTQARPRSFMRCSQVSGCLLIPYPK